MCHLFLTLPFKVDVFSFHSQGADNKTYLGTIKIFTLDYGKRKESRTSLAVEGYRERTSSLESDRPRFEI